MSDRVFSADEVVAAFELAGLPRATAYMTTEGVTRAQWSSGDSRRRVAALALGVLPEGWTAIGCPSAPLGVCGYSHRSRYAINIGSDPGDSWYITGCVAEFKAREQGESLDVACRLLAAHVELVRLRAGGAA